MKNFKFLIVFSALIAISFSLIAQSSPAQYVTSSKGKALSLGHFKSATTTDSTLSIHDTLAIADNTAGLLTVTVAAYDSLGDGVTSKVVYRYKKVAGTLTLAAGANISALVVDAGLGSATTTFTATASNNVQLKIKGKLNYTVKWKTLIERFAPLAEGSY